MSKLKYNKNLVNDYKTSFDSAKTSFNSDSYNTFKNSYLATCSDSTVQSMYNNLDTLYSDIDKGYNSIDNYWTNYNKDNSSLESSLESDSNVCTNSNVSSFLSSFLGNVSNTKSPTLELYQGIKNSFNGTNTSNNIDNDLVFRYDTSKDLSDQINIDDDLTYRPGEDSNEMTLLSNETGTSSDETIVYNCFHDDSSLAELEAAKEKLENVDKTLDKEIELLEAEYDSAMQTAAQNTQPVINLENYPDVKDMPSLNELINQKKAERFQIQMYIKDIKTKINLKPYDDIYNSEEYEKYIKEYEIQYDNFDSERIEPGDYNTAGVATYTDSETGEEIDPLKMAELIYKDAGEDKTVEEVINTYPEVNTQYGMEVINVLDYYPYMTKDEVNMYHYLYETKGRDEANKYLLSTEDVINQRAGIAYADAWIKDFDQLYQSEKDGENFGEMALGRVATLFEVDKKGLSDGIDNFYEGLYNAAENNDNLSRSEYERMIIMNYLQNETDEIDHLDFHYKLSTSVGNMLPAIVTSMCISAITGPEATVTVLGKEIKVAEFAGSSLIGISAGGNAKHQALVNGNNVLSSTLYGICIGLSETTFGYLIGGMPGLSKEAAFGIRSMIQEGVEEYAQEYVDAGLRSALLGEPIDIDQLDEDAKEAFILGCMSSGLVGGTGATFKIIVNGEVRVVDTNAAVEAANNSDISLTEAAIKNSTEVDNAPKYNQGVSNRSNSEYYTIKTDTVKDNPYLLEMINSWTDDMKIDMQVGVNIENTLSDEDCVYGVHRTPTKVWADDIYTNGLMLTGDTGDGIKNDNISLDKNVSFETNNNTDLRNFFIIRDISSSSDYKTINEGEGYGMIIKIPKEYIMKDANGNLMRDASGNYIFDLEKVTYEKNGIRYLKPEFVVAEVEVENNNLIDSDNTRFKSDSNDSTTKTDVDMENTTISETTGKNNAAKFNQGISNALSNNKGSVRVSPFGITESIMNIVEKIKSVKSNKIKSSYTKTEIVDLYNNDPNKLAAILTSSGISEEEAVNIMNSYTSEEIASYVGVSSKYVRDQNVLIMNENLKTKKNVKSAPVTIDTYLGTEINEGIKYSRYRSSDGKIICIQQDYDSSQTAYDVNQLFDNLQEFSDKNPELYKYWKKIYISSSSNPDNSYFQQVYNDPTFVAAGSMNSNAHSSDFGTMRIYKENNYTSIDILAHESAHCLDANSSISDSQGWINAVNADGNFTSSYAADCYNKSAYGETGRYSEDFADFFGVYYQFGKEYVEKNYPNRVEYIKNNMPELYNEMF